MTENKRFKYYEHKGADYILENPNEDLDFIEMLGDCLDSKEIVNRLNELYDENEQLKEENEDLNEELMQCDSLFLLYKEQRDKLKKGNNDLIHLLENQSIIIQELHSKILEFELKEPIVLTKEDLEIMGKAISYYNHGGE